MQAVSPFRSTEAATARRGTGAMFLAGFGTVWLEGWEQREALGPVVFAFIAVLGVLLVGAAYLRYRRFAPALAREPKSAEQKRAGRVFHIVNVVQWIAILGLANVLIRRGLGAWVIPMAIFVIGLHFVPLAHVFRNPPHYLTAAAMVVFAALYPMLARGGAADPVGFLGAGLILWASAAWALFRKA